jgi:hypothetical protein
VNLGFRVLADEVELWRAGEERLAVPVFGRTALRAWLAELPSTPLVAGAVRAERGPITGFARWRGRESAGRAVLGAVTLDACLSARTGVNGDDR